MSFERKLEFDDAELARDLLGPHNRNLALIQTRLGVDVQARGGLITINASTEAEADLAANCLTQIYSLIESGSRVHAQDFDFAVRILSREPQTDLKRFFKESVFAISSRKTVTPQTISQRTYMAALRERDLVFGIGPAGTGKTYLAVANAVSSLLKKEVKRIVLTRPAVEAGEKLGFLPGDLVEKVNPYLRPLYDALHDMLDFRRVQEMIEEGVIEIAPLAFMRGRTLNNAFVILDEAQNTTFEQMKMFLTRLGFGSRAVVTGDVTQIDLPSRVKSGLIVAEKILGGVPGIEFIRFREDEVIRHPLVGRIVQAYERFEQAEREEAERRKRERAELRENQS